jgi:transcription elongation factor GreA
MADYNDKEYLTKEKFEELKKELDFLSTTKRKEIADQLEFAKSLGDISENAEYHEAREQQAITEDRIRKIEYVLKNAEIVTHNKKSDVIQIGSTVVIKKEKEGENKEYVIVGSEEADTSKGRISNSSPIGQALMGKKKNEEFIFQTPSGNKIKYKIISVK